MRRLVVMTLALASACCPGSALAAVSGSPAAGISSSFASPPATISSSLGSGDFGRWRVDAFGLPSYRYLVDELHDPFARQPELAGSTDAQHQVGNDHIVAAAFNHGYTQLWSQDRRYEWTNRYDAATEHFAGAFGYLRAGRRVISTLYDDRPRASQTVRDFGVGYFRHQLAVAGLVVDEHVYAPFGDDPVLLHDVTIRNDSSRRRRISWFEYWDVNPFDQATKVAVGMGAVRWLPGSRALVARQLPTALDRRPLTIFAAALRGPVDGRVADVHAFFGAGSRAVPASVAAGRLSGALAPSTPAGHVGRAMFGFRAAVVLAPHSSIVLRYEYGAVHGGVIAHLVRKYRAAPSPLGASALRWRAWLPQIAFGRGRPWLSRELQWDAYTVRSGATYEDCRGRHIVSQGGYYQYALGFQGAFRDPLQHILPMVYSDPALARDVLLYSAQEQPHLTGQIPYAMSELCHRLKFGNSDDLDLWLLLAAAEYGLGTRDLQLFDRRVAYAGGSGGRLWDHLKLAFRHQESLRGPHGGYLAQDVGDWSDLSTSFLHMTESTLVDAQAAYIYSRVALLADARGDHAFASQLRRAAARDLRVTRGQWTARGWYARGYAGNQAIGTGAIFGEQQPWAILAGAPSIAQDEMLVSTVRRFLTGVGSPPSLNGPARIGSSQSPAANDPLVTERTQPPGGGIGGDAAVFPGGSWYAINGWLSWALGTLDGVVAHAREYAFSELERNTLAAHAQAYPQHWDGTISVDDVCHSFYSTTPATCGAALTTGYQGQILHQPAWSLFDAIRLAGIEPTERGFRIQPELPFRTFSLALPDVGVAYGTSTAHGYFVTAADTTLRLQVHPPAGRRWRIVSAGHAVRGELRHGLLVFDLSARAGRVARWEIARAH